MVYLRKSRGKSFAGCWGWQDTGRDPLIPSYPKASERRGGCNAARAELCIISIATYKASGIWKQLEL